MSFLIDDLARALASPMPRRQAVRAVTGLLGGSVLGSLGLKRAIAQSAAGACPRGTTKCGTICCESGKTCCTTSSKPFCITAGKVCCGSFSCTKGKICCTTSSKPFCATAGKTCCGSTACGKGQTCCHNSTCCGPNQICKNGRCQSSNV